MLYETLTFFNNYINLAFLLFTITLLLSFLAMAIIFTKISLRHAKKATLQNVDQVSSSPIAPSITIIAPAYNEEANIVENIKSLLSLQYHNFEIIIVNDGSSDGTLSKIVQAFDLDKIKGQIPHLPCKPINGIYESGANVLNRLVVIDKENGGKSDALNAGINYATSRYVGCIDADCILHPDSLSHVVRAFFESKKKKVVAVGGVLRVANSCKIKEGVVEKVRLPKSWLAKYQLLEYTRSFLLGRMSWAGIDGLLIISGAFSFFDRQILLNVGGYSTDTVGEDMEVVFKLRRYMVENKQPYTISYLPEALCYTEVPEDIKILVNQRDRWSRGNIETLKKHKAMFFNAKYGRLGMLSYPFWFVYEWLAPLLEFFGFMLLLLFWYHNILDWNFLLAISLVIYSCALNVSLYTIAWDFQNYQQYGRNRDYFSLIICAITEPILFHPIVVFASVRGNVKKLLQRKSEWGKITRKGFTTH